MALMHKIPLIFMGESQSEAGSSDEIDEIMMKYEYWSKSENQKILISGCELDELEKNIILQKRFEILLT